MKRRDYFGVIVVAALAGFVGGALGVGWRDSLSAATSPYPKQLASEQFLLVGHDGKMRAELANDSAGWPFLEMFDPKLIRRAMLATGPSGAHLFLYDELGENLSGMSLLTGGRPVFFFSNRKGHVQASLSSEPQGGTLFKLDAPDGTKRLLAAVGADGTPAIQLFDAKGKIIFREP